MTIEVRLKGRKEEWRLEGSRLRLGRGAACEAALPAIDFPMVSREHAALEATAHGWRLVDLHSANGTFVNGDKIEARELRPGDVVRLGADGPELELFWQAPAEAVASVDHAAAATRVGAVESATVVETKSAPTVVEHGEEPTIVDRPADAPTAVGHVDAKTVVGRIDAPTVVEQAEAKTSVGRIEARGADETPTEARGQSAGNNAQTRVHIDFPAPTGADVAPAKKEKSPADYKPLPPQENPMLENKVNALRGLVIAQFVVIVALLFALLYAVQQVNQTRKDVQALRQQAGDAVQQLTPQLDERIQKIDEKLNGFDAKSQQAEDRFMQRVNTELPKLLDKYVETKMKSLPQRAETLQR